MQFNKCARDKRTGQFVCVLDGLDECEAGEREQLLAGLGKFIAVMRDRSPDEPRSRVKFFLTSRPLQDELEWDFERLRDAAGAGVTWLIDMDEMGSVIRADKEPAIQSAANLVIRKQKEVVESILRGNEHRNWLWLRVAVELIINSQNAAKRHTSLHQPAKVLLFEFPKSVEGVYEKALEFASVKYGRPLVQKLMHIILGARRCLSKPEVLLALTVVDTDIGASISSVKKRTHQQLCKERPELAQLLETFDGAILEVMPSTKEIDIENARGFLMQQEKQASAQSPTSWKGSVRESAAQDTLTRACLSYILILEREPNASLKEEEAKVGKREIPEGENT